MEESEESIQDIIHKADIALYHAKETGKDRSIVYDGAVMGNTVTGK
jgi:PleD family two-component response regulator